MKPLLITAFMAISLNAWSANVASTPPALKPEGSAALVKTPSQKPKPESFAPEKPASTTASLPVPATLSSVKSESEHSIQPEAESGHWWDKMIAWSTLFLAVFTFGLAVATAFLARYTWKLWNATGQLVSEDKKTSEQELRAYIQVKGTTLTTTNDGKSHAIEFEIKNVGHTPAHEVRVFAATRVLGYPLSPTYDVHFGEQSFPSRSVLFRDDFLEMQSVPDGQPPTNFSALFLNNSTHKLYLVCRIDYLDIFNKPHSTFHVSYVVSTFNQGLGMKPKTMFAFASAGNKLT